ncbi:MAG: PIN domain-containing protein [Flavobacteriales bacterium]|nr:PIN domain-containing protein [Flavobacteriales bacterium]
MIIPLSDSVKDEVIYFRKTYKSKLPDSIIAATASVFSLTLFTFDKEFSKFTDAQVVVLN